MAKILLKGNVIEIRWLAAREGQQGPEFCSFPGGSLRGKSADYKGKKWC